MYPFTHQHIYIATKCLPFRNVTTLSPHPRIVTPSSSILLVTPSPFLPRKFLYGKHCGIIYSIPMICVAGYVFSLTSLFTFI